MKFILALIATAAAIKVTASNPGQCVDEAHSDKVFDEVDVNGDGQVDKKELTAAINVYLDANNIHPTKAQIKLFTATAYADAGANKTLNKTEANKLANQVAHYLEPANCSA